VVLSVVDSTSPKKSARQSMMNMIFKLLIVIFDSNNMFSAIFHIIALYASGTKAVPIGRTTCTLLSEPIEGTSRMHCSN